MALYYGIPTFAKAGAGDAKILDQQAGVEIGLSIYHEYLVGNNLIHDMGYLESGMTASLESMVICDEVASLVKHIGKGFDFSPYHMALEEIEKVGPEGNYLVEDFTLDNFRETFWFPNIMDHNNYSSWLKIGSKDMESRAHEIAQQILERHQPVPLSRAVNKEIDSILAFAE
jgi:trimethylamine--corrinoid protein Co-methyltransferase